MSSRTTIAALVVAAVAAGLGLDWWWSPAHRLDRAVGALAQAPRSTRFAAGRLSVDRRWAAAPVAVRGAASARPSLDVVDAALSIERLAPSAGSREALHARALAAVASGDVDAAIDQLRRALALAGGDAAAIRSDLAAVLLERGRRQGEATDIVDALDESSLALSESAGLAPALFNQAVALEVLGPRLAAAAAWDDYLAVDTSSSWAAEARERAAGIRSRPQPPHLETTRRLHELELTLLPEWARRTLAGERADTARVAAAIGTLTPETADREVLHLAEAAIRFEHAAAAVRACVARAIVALDDWRAAYDRGVQDPAQQAAQEAERQLACAHLPTAGARLRFALAGDRNKVYALLGELAPEAAAQHYLRIASLARIARGNSALRRTDFTVGMGELQLARRLADQAGDLELTATADAMIADGYSAMGEPPSAWRALQQALEGLPAAASRRLEYSILQAAAGAPLGDGHAAASLPYSKLLLEATANWQQPGGRILASLDRARALQDAGLPAQAAAAIDTAERALPGVQDPNLRAEWTATVTLARGHLAVATAPSAAVPLLTDAYAYFTRHQTAFRLASILLDRGRAFRATGKPAEARRDWDAAASIIEDQQPAVRVEQLRVSRFNALWDVFAELERADKTDAAAGLASSERARARALLDSLAPDQRAVPLAGAALWTWLPPDTAAVVYSVLPEELLVWIVDRSGPRLREVPITAGALDALVGQALDGIAAGQVEDLRPLSALLLRDLPPGRPDATLLIVPDGPLHFLPFAALPLPGTSARLVETWTPVVTPSLSVARTLAQRVGARAAGSHVLLVGYEGDAASGLPLLRGVDRELEALRQAYPRAEVLRGSAATADAFARAAATSALIHVAAHGVLNLAYPSRSHILLAGPPDAQPLTAPRIAALTLEANPTVVLTACDAARGRVYRGEGQLSLARPFLIAGAASVIAAQMPVSDVTAPAFDADLAARLTQDRDGPRALAAVQRAWIARHAPERDWAVFSVMGSIEPGRQVTRWQ